MKVKLDWLKGDRPSTRLPHAYLLVVAGGAGGGQLAGQPAQPSWDSTAEQALQPGGADRVKVVKGSSRTPRSLISTRRTLTEARDLLDRYDNLSPRLTVEPMWILTRSPNWRGRRASRAFPRSSSRRRAGARRPPVADRGTDHQRPHPRAQERGTQDVCFVKGSGEHLLEDTGQHRLLQFQGSAGEEQLQQHARSRCWRSPRCPDCTMLVVAARATTIVEPQVEAIKKYVEAAARAVHAGSAPEDG
jgi:hypothetical protein